MPQGIVPVPICLSELVRQLLGSLRSQASVLPLCHCLALTELQKEMLCPSAWPGGHCVNL